MSRRTPPAAPRAPVPPPAPTGRALDRWLVAGLVLAALALRLNGIREGLPEVYEEAYPFKIAWRMWGWGPERGFDPNPHWFWYPGLTIVLQFLGQALLFLVLKVSGAIQTTLDFRLLLQLDKTPFYLMGRSITAILGAATVVPTFQLARRVAGRGAGLTAAILVALSPGLIVKSTQIGVDVPLTLLVATSLLAAVRLADGLAWRRVLAAAVVVGLAAGAKYPGLVLVVPCTVAILLAAGPRARTGDGARRARGLDGLGGKVRALVLFAIVSAATFFATSPFLFLDYRSALADLQDQNEYMRLGHFGSDLGPAWISYLREWFMDVAGWPVALASLAALVLFMGVRRQAWALVTGSFVVAYAGLVASFALKADRYLLPLLPPAFVFAAALVAAACARLAVPMPLGGWVRAVTQALAAVVLALPALQGLPRHLAGPRPDTRTLARAWFEANVPPGAFIASEQYGPSLQSPLEFQAVERDLLAALKARGYVPKVYALLSVPVFQVVPERSAKYYDPSLYRIADAFIVTGSARDRYRREPARFAAQLAFYDTLAATWEVWKEFPSNGGAGPDMVVYRHPANRVPFSQRRPHPGPPPTLTPGPATGGEGFFNYNLGLNYELFGFAGGALPAYLEGFTHLASEPDVAIACIERAAGVLVRLGRIEDAIQLIDQAASQATRPADRERLRQARVRAESLRR